MKALVYTGAAQMEYREEPDPAADGDYVLIKVDGVGICGSDMHGYLGHDPRRVPPLILGHEVAGTICAGEHDGKRVVVNPILPCYECRTCKLGLDNVCLNRRLISIPPDQGGFAEFLKMPFANTVEVPDDVSFDKAVLTEPIACGWHATRLGEETLGSRFDTRRALVLGGGAIGVGSAVCLLARGWDDITIVEPNAGRLKYITDKFPAVRAIDGDQLGASDMFELVVDAVGVEQTRATACAHAHPAGAIAHIGLGSGEGGGDFRRMTLQEITFICSYSYDKADFVETAGILFKGGFGDLDWIEQREMSGGKQAFDDILEGKVATPKIILKPN